ncbi:MAG: hypothetical protein ACRDKW_10260 [Actinomycetota bacterium]
MKTRRAPRRATRLLLCGAVLAAASGWWLLAEPVHSAVLWTIGRRGNHGLQAADVPGLLVLALAVLLGARGARLVARSRRPAERPEL